jgi:hypothetical protein
MQFFDLIAAARPPNPPPMMRISVLYAAELFAFCTMFDSPCIWLMERSVRIHELSRHLRYDVDALSRTIDFASKTPDAIPLVRDSRLLFGFVPSHHIHKTSLDAGLTASTFI